MDTRRKIATLMLSIAILLNVPVAFFYSGQNKAYPDAWAQKIASAYNSVELIKVTGTGHNGIISDRTAWKEQTLPEILQYFKSL